MFISSRHYLNNVRNGINDEVNYQICLFRESIFPLSFVSAIKDTHLLIRRRKTGASDAIEATDSVIFDFVHRLRGLRLITNGT